MGDAVQPAYNSTILPDASDFGIEYIHPNLVKYRTWNSTERTGMSGSQKATAFIQWDRLLRHDYDTIRGTLNGAIGKPGTWRLPDGQTIYGTFKYPYAVTPRYYYRGYFRYDIRIDIEEK